MALTTTQLQTLRTAALANPTAAAIITAGNTFEMQTWLNGKQTPTVKAWKTRYSGDDLYNAHKPVEYIARSAAERSAFDLMIARIVDPSRNIIRKGIEDIFSGAQNSTSRASILNDMQENATRAEVIIGGTTQATAVDAISGLNRGFVGLVSVDEARSVVQGV